MSIDNIWRRFTKNGKTNPVNIVAHRFLQAFQDHGVEASQIPRLVPQLKIADLQSSEKLLAALTPEILDQTAKLFCIRSQWLEGVDDQIYEYLACYKSPEIILGHLARLVCGHDVALTFPLRVLTTTKKLDFRSDAHQLLVPVLVEKVFELGEEDICRYHVYRDGFDWGYEPSRLELKAIARIVYTELRAVVPLFEIGPKEMDDVLEGRSIPRRYLDGCMLTNPSLEDFALKGPESGIAKETEEFPLVLEYIKAHNLQDFSFDDYVEAQPDEPVSYSAPSCKTREAQESSGKRAQAQFDWESVRNAARTLWAEDDQLSIADVIRRIKLMPIFKASAFTESAIRKRINDLAPPHIRGKSGRKPKKST